MPAVTKQIYITGKKWPVWEAVQVEASQAGLSLAAYVTALLEQRTPTQIRKAGRP